MKDPEHTEADNEQVKRALLATQRHSWEQGVAAQALLELGKDSIVGGQSSKRSTPDALLT